MPRLVGLSRDAAHRRALRTAERQDPPAALLPVALLVLVALLVPAGCSGSDPTPPPAPGPAPAPAPASVSVSVSVSASVPAPSTARRTNAPTSPVSSLTTATPTPAVGRGRELEVHDAATLTTALAAARPGTTIILAAGAYRGQEVRGGHPDEPGRFFATTPGTAAAPITVRGPREAVIDGGGSGGGYGFHLTGADFWRLEGFTVRSASKGIVLDRSSHVRIADVRVTDIGAEGVHFRSFSSDNVLTDSDVDHTGVRKPNFGEGVYVGSAVSNWKTYSAGVPDTSDRNQIVDNRISATGAENIDIKEGSSSGIVRGNLLDGSEIAGRNSADSWIDVKGNGYTIEANRGTQSLLDGFQVHVQAEGWGARNVFRANTLDVGAPGVGIWLQNVAVGQGNVIECSNVVTAAGAGDYATDHYRSLRCVP